ncbi:hypothetical protein WICMUC_003610 [Wickerhamomyces mucosus]|uniref:Aspartate aminotransferase n=1 Tax=Wickerhamomyces mucosus TaxID=1378264 RepID=A0A9P8TCB3_9ASCO|nr:hypothetical protein WICMUC_003610 [Wickerhamomyces mucosus]
MIILRYIQKNNYKPLTRSLASLSNNKSISTPSTNSYSKQHNIWNHIPLAKPDPILSIIEEFNRDGNPQKINLSVGAYRDESGKPFILPSIKQASKILFDQESDKEYTSINGSLDYNRLVKQFLFGGFKSGKFFIEQDRIVLAQSLSGTGALKLSGEFLKNWNFKNSNEIFIPSSTWANHYNIFKNCGLKISQYSYIKNNSLDLTNLLKDLNQIPLKSSILFHACCHNPTGLNPTRDEWLEILKIVSERELIPIVDLAYQGFESGNLQQDLYLVEMICNKIANDEISTALICQSFAKNMGLYGERIGSISIITQNSNQTFNIESQLKKTIRSIYSSPSIHGSKLVEIVLSNDEIYQNWQNDVAKMSSRIKKMRFELFNLLNSMDNNLNWNHLIQQNGMFCFTGLSEQQILKLKNEYSIYSTLDGRFSISGINMQNIKYLAESINKVINST